MKNYEDFKEWLEEHKIKFILAGCFILVFFVGFGTGRYQKDISTSKPIESKTLNNYNKNSQTNLDTQKQVQVIEVGNTSILPGSTTSTASTSQTCFIKGNFSSKGEKIYHVIGGAFYNLVKPEQCFSTEQEAINAGFRKSAR